MEVAGMRRIILAVCALSGATGAFGQGFRRSPSRTELLTSQRMHEITTLPELPPELDWRWKDGHNFTTVNRNQHIPSYCGACYAFGSISALSDRIRIARGAAGREINLAVQVELNCDLADLGCSGGDPAEVYRFIVESGGIPEESCQPYEAVGHDTGRTCLAQDVCRRCDAGGCSAQLEYDVYGIQEFGMVSGEFPIMAELQRGPVACAISTPDVFLNYVGYGILQDPSENNRIDHVISVVGYGAENGTKYWVVRNSWGTYWGHFGWARIARGTNTLMIETDCVWATPSNGGWPERRRAGAAAQGEKEPSSPQTPKPKRPPAGGVAADLSSPQTVPCRVQRSDWQAVGGERVLTHERVRAMPLPSRWDWRNVSGASYTTWNTNEHLPQGGCASCWAQGVASSLGDRIAVLQGGRWPQVGLSPQMLINCRGGGSCAGGDPAAAYAFIYRHGITDETCQNYQAVDLECNGMGICMNCAPAGEHGLSWPGNCQAVKNPIVWFLSEYGSVHGATPMKREIYLRGPIGCGMEASPSFRNYSGGVFSEVRPAPVLDHEVSIAGWGVAGARETVVEGTEFWIGRNSYGTYWGEDGWFRIRMHLDNLGVELDCDWGVPQQGPAVPSSMTAPPPAADVPPAGQGVHIPFTAWLLLMTAALLVGALSWASWLHRPFRARWPRGGVEDTTPYIRVA